MNDYDFNCVLKINKGDAWQGVEIGRCTVYDDKTADFKCRFVPFYPVGTILRLYRIIGKEEVSFFEGKVYLSTSSFLRLTNITETVIDSNVKFFRSDVNISAKGKIILNSPAEKLFYKGERKFDVSIFELSQSILKFTSMEKSIPKGSLISISFEEPFKSEDIFCRVYEFLNISGISPKNGKDDEAINHESDVFAYLANIESLSPNDLSNIKAIAVKLKSESLRILK